MNIRERIKKEIKIQKEIEKDKCQDKILLQVLEILKSQNQWNLLIDVRYYRYGKLSYETHRFYYPKKELLKIIKLI